MHSSTSSSSNTSVRAVPLKAWILAPLIILVLLAVLEVVVREAGYQPSVPDTKALWAMHRDAVRENGPGSVVLLGASRMQLGVDPEILQEALGGRSVSMLAVRAAAPMATLEHFASDETFDGVVICSFIERWIEPEMWDRQLDYVKYWTNGWSTREKIKLSAHLHLHGRSALLNGALALASLRRQMEGHGDYSYLTFRRSRYGAADYLAMGEDLPDHRNERGKQARAMYAEGTELTTDEFVSQCERLERAVRAIQDRGGRVVFVRLPTSGEVWELDEQYYPKKRYWDVFAERTAAATIHFKDYETLASFECADGSHLDYRDAAVFTRSLADVLKEKIE